MRSLGLLLCGLLLAGCQATVLRPAMAHEAALRHPDLAAWMEAHSAPQALEGLSAWEVKRWRNYRPAATVDVVHEGMVVRFHSVHGPAPRGLEVLLHPQSGEILGLTQKR